MKNIVNKRRDNKKCESELDSKKRLFSIPNKNRKSEANIHETQTSATETSLIFASLCKKHPSSYCLSAQSADPRVEASGFSFNNQTDRSEQNWSRKNCASRNGRKHSANCHIIHRPGCSSSLADVTSTVLATSGIKQVINYPDGFRKTSFRVKEEQNQEEGFPKVALHSVSCKEHRKRESLKNLLLGESSRSKSFSSSSYESGLHILSLFLFIL